MARGYVKVATNEVCVGETVVEVVGCMLVSVLVDNTMADTAGCIPVSVCIV